MALQGFHSNPASAAQPLMSNGQLANLFGSLLFYSARNTKNAAPAARARGANILVCCTTIRMFAN